MRFISARARVCVCVCVNYAVLFGSSVPYVAGSDRCRSQWASVYQTILNPFVQSFRPVVFLSTPTDRRRLSKSGVRRRWICTTLRRFGMAARITTLWRPACVGNNEITRAQKIYARWWHAGCKYGQQTHTSWRPICKLRNTQKQNHKNITRVKPAIITAHTLVVYTEHTAR